MPRVCHLTLTLALALAACGRPAPEEERLGGPRFENLPIAWEVADRRDVPEPPPEAAYHWKRYYFDGFVTRPLRRGLGGQKRGRAEGTNALDEVPSSTWFTNRIGHDPFDPEVLRRGPGDDDSPELRKPWKVVAAKTEGVTPGYVIEDAGGVKWVLKLEIKGFPEMETAADSVVSRLVWAAGYNVPHDTVVYFREQDLQMTEEVMARVDGPDAEGRFRGTASRFLDGKPLGPIPPMGTRAGDPNDLVPHERRRELRGAYPLFSWLHHVDVKPDNTLDMWVEGEDGRHHVRHHLIDFGKSLGTLAVISAQPSSGFAHVYHGVAREAVPFEVPAWEKLQRPAYLGVGMYEATLYDPGGFHTNVPYAPFEHMDRFDGYWGAKLVMSFRREHLVAAIAAGRYSDERARAYLLETLEARQRATARYWFERVSPLDGFDVREGGKRLCFVDLYVRHGLDPGPTPRPTAVVARAYAHSGRALAWRAEVKPDAGGQACVEAVPAGPDHDGYVIVELVVRRADQVLPPVLVHLAEDPATRAPRVIGVRRE